MAVLAGGSARIVTLVSAAFLLGFAAADAAEAASRFCLELEARLEDPGQSAQFREYDRAANEQYNELKLVERQAERAGCLGGFFGRGGGECPGLIGTLERMDRNLAMLERRRDQLARAGNSRRERARIMAALQANRCGEEDRDEQKSVRILPPPLDTNDNRSVISGPFGPGLSGTYRTLCVRTCDGYFFPVSFSVTPDLLGRDQESCQQMCPGTEVELYVHEVPGQESEDMMSLAGTPYTEMPNAFKYRAAGYVRAEGCGCSPSKDFSILAGEPDEVEAPVEGEPSVPLPTPRPDPAADPETLANREGGLDRAAIEKILTPKPVAPAAIGGGERKIRVVGPVFLPDPAGAIDLRSPGRSSAQ